MASPPRPASGTISHTSGLLASYPSSTDEEKAYWNADLRFQGATVAKIRPRHEDASYPVILVQDPSGGSARPLYALVAESGEFLEFYRQVAKGDSRLYTIARGFRPARMESFRGRMIEDEASPGAIAFGEDYRIEVPVSRTSRTHNRIASSVFKLGADRMRELFRPDRPVSEDHAAARALHRADIQAEIIEKLPTFAGTLLPHRSVPWEGRGEGSVREYGEFELPHGMEWTFSPREDEQVATALLPTAPGTVVADYVDTGEEGRLIQLAIAVGENERAAAILDFYWDKSRGGTLALHDSYDRTSGASLAREPHLKRASEASRIAGAQLAIAEAALVFAEETGDQQAWTLGVNLLDLLFDKFRSLYRSGSPRGISEREFQRRHRRLGLVLWPEPARYLVETNARALLVLSKALRMASAFVNADAAIRQRMERIREEQRAWLVQFVVPQVQRSGVVPNALFEIQDLQSETSALGVSRWTSARGWLAFLEVTALIGTEPEQGHRWLENLARIHGVEIDDRWGIDWSIALTRHDAISPELTAYFFKVAEILGHAEAAAFAREELFALGGPDGKAIPVVLTHASPKRRVRIFQSIRSRKRPLGREGGRPTSTSWKMASWSLHTSPRAGVASKPESPLPRRTFRPFDGACLDSIFRSWQLRLAGGRDPLAGGKRRALAWNRS